MATDLPGYLHSIVAPGVEVDPQKLLVGGESAGGWLALHSALSLSKDAMKAMLLPYPMTKRWPDAERLVPMGAAAPPESIVDECLAAHKNGDVVSSAAPPARDDLSATTAVYFHRWEEAFGTEESLHPINGLGAAKYWPPTSILHGKQDNDVDLEECRRFVEKVGDVLGEETRGQVRLVEVDGGHGFDAELVEEDTPWLEEELRWIEERWLK